LAWVRLYTETKNDRKIRRLDPAHRWLWCVLLMMAKESPVEGWLYIAEGEPATIDDIADTWAPYLTMSEALRLAAGLFRTNTPTSCCA